MMRIGNVERETAETNIRLEWRIDGKGDADIDTSVPFMDHMLTLMCCHGFFDLSIFARGDLEVDGHHLLEDLGIAMGLALDKALGNRQGCKRYGSILLPMDECLAQVAIDLSGRPCLVYDFPPLSRLGSFDSDLVKEFLNGFVNNGRLNLHARLLAPGNGHHALEALFKGLGRALDTASQLDPREKGIPSTKGVL